MRNLKTLKIIYSLEFDPYFSKASCLVALKKLIERNKLTRSVNLIIRRVDFTDEMNCLYPCLYKLNRLEKIRLEFPSTSNVTEAGLIKFITIIRRFYSVRSLSWNFLDVKTYSSKCGWAFNSAQRRLILLEEANSYVTSSSDYARERFYVRNDTKPFRAARMKKVTMALGIESAWSYLNENTYNISAKEHMRVLSYFHNLREITLKAIRHPLDSQIIYGMLEVLENFIDLNHVTLEILGCKFDDVDLMAYAIGISKMRFLKRFTFKAFGNQSVPADVIVQFVIFILKAPNLTRFDILLKNFRRLDLEEEPRNQMMEKVLMLNKDLTCSYYKRTLYISR